MSPADVLDDDEPGWICGALGPLPFPGAAGAYRCSLRVDANGDHAGVHEAWADGERLDSWPQQALW